MAKCYLCGDELTQSNMSDEHIIINGIGGRLKSADLLCATCNSKLGNKSDSVLSEDLKFFVEMFQVQKQRNKELKGIVMKDQDGDEIIVRNGGYDLELRKPKIEVHPEKDGVTPIHIKARNQKELDNILNGLSAKGVLKQEDVKKILSEAKVTEDRKPLQGAITIREEAFPSIVKTVVNFMVYKKGSFDNIDNIRPYIWGDKDCQEVLRLAVLPEFRLCPDYDSLYHTIKICGSEGQGLIGLFEMFNTYAYAVVLDKNYKGEPIDECYCFDVVNTRIVDHNPVIALTNDSIENAHSRFHSNPNEVWDEMKWRMDRVMGLKDNRDRKAEIESVIDDVLGSLPPGSVITEDIINQLSTQIVDKVVKPRLK